MAIKQLHHNSIEYGQMVELRFDILRKPLGLVFLCEELQKEKDDVLIGAFDDDKIIGCCILTKQDKQCIRLRQMAVKNSVQRMGIGESLIAYAENIAIEKGFKFLIMHARDTATGFYKKYGYKVLGEAFNEVNIKHYLMEKSLQ